MKHVPWGGVRITHNYWLARLDPGRRHGSTCLLTFAILGAAEKKTLQNAAISHKTGRQRGVRHSAGGRCSLLTVLGELHGAATVGTGLKKKV